MSFHFNTFHIIYGQVWKLILWAFEQPKTSLLLTSAGRGHTRTGALIPKSLWSKDLIKRSIYRRLKINASTSWHPCFYPCLSICWPRSLSLFPLQSPAWLWSPVAFNWILTLRRPVQRLVSCKFLHVWGSIWAQIMRKVCCFNSLGWT